MVFRFFIGKKERLLILGFHYLGIFFAEPFIPRLPAPRRLNKHRFVRFAAQIAKEYELKSVFRTVVYEFFCKGLCHTRHPTNKRRSDNRIILEFA